MKANIAGLSSQVLSCRVYSSQVCFRKPEQEASSIMAFIHKPTEATNCKFNSQ